MSKLNRAGLKRNKVISNAFEISRLPNFDCEGQFMDPSTSVAQDNAAVGFCCVAPEMFCGLQSSTRHSNSMKVNK